ncbi:hypothetical protein CCL13_17120 [Pseudomonas syringae]|nr:hypothetical protein CCL13_17120 [Pseudomonas syringae]
MGNEPDLIKEIEVQAPTDNLYKFLAISGLICMLFFYFDYNRRKEQLQNKKDEWIVSALELNSAIDASSREFKALEMRFQKFGSQAKTAEELKAEFDRAATFQQEFNKLGIKVEPTSYKLQIVQRLEKELAALKSQYTSYSAWSLGIFLIGIVLWYYQTQRHLDAKERT